MGQAWIFCKNKLMDRAERIEDFDKYALQDATDASKLVLQSKMGIEEAMEALPPIMKDSFLDCLQETNPQLPVFSSKDVMLKGWFLKCGAFLLSSWLHFPRRSLAGNHPKLLKDLPSSPPSWSSRIVQSPAPAPSLHHRPGDPPEHSPAPAPAPSMDLAPSSTSSPSPAPEPIAGPPDPPKISEPPHMATNRSHLPAKPHAAPPPPPAHRLDKKKGSDDNRMIIAFAVAATAAAIFLLLALIFLCCLRSKKKKVRDAHKDDSPLLKLSLSDSSANSSQNSQNIGKSSNKDFSAASTKNSSSANHLSTVPETHDPAMPGAYSMETNTSMAFPPLKPPPPGPPPPPPPKPRPPAPPKTVRPPPVPLAKPSHSRGNSVLSDGDDSNGDPDAPKAKLKPFFWDKVAATPNHEMVWHEIKAGSFQFNEEMMESLFGYAADKNNGNCKKELSSAQNAVQYIQIIDTKKAQNLSILLKALNVTIEEVCNALQEGTKLPMELLQTLLKMAPTTQEELKLRLYSGDLSQLGPAERFLKILVDIPFAFKRFEALQFMGIAEEEVLTVKESRGGAEAFKLDTLLKLSDVRGTDGKTTLLHFVIKEIIRSEGIRAMRTARESQSISSLKSDESVLEDSSPESAEHLRTLGLQVVSGLTTELEDVKKAALVDADSIAGSLAKLDSSLVKARELLNTDMRSMDEESEFLRALSGFVERIEEEVAWISKEEKRITTLVEHTADYFHGNAGKSEGLRLFVIVRDFLLMLDKACAEVRDSGMQMNRSTRKETSAALMESPSRDKARPSPIDMRQRLFPGIAERQMYDSSSDDESDAGS